MAGINIFTLLLLFRSSDVQLLSVDNDFFSGFQLLFRRPIAAFLTEEQAALITHLKLLTYNLLLEMEGDHRQLRKQFGFAFYCAGSW